MRGLNETTTRVLGLAAVAAYALLIVWLYGRQPQTIAQVTGGVSAAFGAYRIDEQAFAEGLEHFRAARFADARRAFARADPAERHARTQFYIAYSFYRQGWGRLYNDDELFAEGLAAVDRALALAPGGRLIVEDPDLGMRTADELKTELEAGMRLEPSDFNPARVIRGRK